MRQSPRCLLRFSRFINTAASNLAAPAVPLIHRDEFEVVAIDMRGYNESSAPKVHTASFRCVALQSDLVWWHMGP